MLPNKLDVFNKLSANNTNRTLGIFLLLLSVSSTVMAHPLDELGDLSRTDVAWIYLQLGYTHILPFGLDHILFVASLFLLNPKLKPILWQASAFTVAHTITLGLAMYGVIKPPANIVEPIIALSIMYVALENVFSSRLRAGRIGVVFLFGLIHGMGFASSLADLGLPEKGFFSSLIMFNVGVELGQVTVILALFLLLGWPFGKKEYYHKRIVVPLSLLIAAISLYWVVERIWFNG